ncbi:MAG: DUF418 domain-containing protein [Ferruginibacter sp.]
MSTDQTAGSIAAPVEKKERILFLDAIRGIALLGILLMNSMAQSQPHFYYASMNLSQPITGMNFYAWIVECMFFEGTMRGLFSILFGAGTLLFLSRLIKQMPGLAPADIFYRRMLWLLFFGLINAFVFLWPGDILYPYAICGLLLFPFRNLSVNKLLMLALFMLVIGTYRENSELRDQKSTISKGLVAQKLETNKQPLTDVQKADLGKFTAFKEGNTSDGIAKRAVAESKEVKGKSYATIFSYLKTINMKIQSFGFYNSYWFDIFLCFFLGMALFKSGYLLGNKPVYLYAIVAVVGIALGIGLNYFIMRTQYRLRFDNYLLTQQMDFSYYQIRRVFQTTGYLSLFILLYKVVPLRKIFQIFVPVGQMAFTNYLSQSIITSIIFHGVGLYDSLQRYQVYYIVFSIWIFQIIFSAIWLRYFRFGPFEWLWRSLTYKKRQPMLRKEVVEQDAQQDDSFIPSPAMT